MSEQKWTPEPWSVACDRRETFIAGGADGGLAAIFAVGKDDGMGGATLDGQDSGNLFRAVACVNALAGIPDPAAFMERAKAAIEWADSAIACGAVRVGPNMENIHAAMVAEEEMGKKMDAYRQLKGTP